MLELVKFPFFPSTYRRAFLQSWHSTACCFSSNAKDNHRNGKESSKSDGDNSNHRSARNSNISIFLKQLDQTVSSVLHAYSSNVSLSQVSKQERESLATARRLKSVLTQNKNKCQRCWLLPNLCICDQCPPLESKSKPFHSNIHRIFVVMHHQEVCLTVDTAKLILSSFPETARLVVSGIGPDHQETMKEMMQAMQQEQSNHKCLVLFPTPDAKVFDDCFLLQDRNHRLLLRHDEETPESAEQDRWDLIVIDGTWSQARKLCDRYIPTEANGGPRRVKLSDRDVDSIGQRNTIIDSSDHDARVERGRQLRKHPIQWREISTLEALRLLLRDIISTYNQMGSPTTASKPSVWETLSIYQDKANAAARQQRGR